MKQFVRGRFSRAISSLLMALLLLPCLTLPLGSVGLAATSGEQNIVLLPLTTAVGTAPNNLGGRIYKELQINLASQPGVQVTKLTLHSPIFIRANDQLAEEERTTLADNFKKACDPTTESSARIKAAGYLAKTLQVDAVVYGAIDQYEYTDTPDPRQSFIHISATKVISDSNKEALSFPVVVIGKSKVRLKDTFAQAIHDDEAIYNAARNFAIQLTSNGSATDNTIAAYHSPNGKMNGALLYGALGLALVAVAVLSGGSSGGSGGGSTPAPLVTTPDPPTNLSVAEETIQNQGLTIKTGYPVLNWVASDTSTVIQYQIFRDDSRSRTSNFLTSPAGPKKLMNSGRNHRSRLTRLLASTSGVSATRGVQLIKTLSGRLTTTFSDDPTNDPNPPVNGTTYTYYIKSVVSSGSTTLVSATSSNQVPFGPIDIETPAQINGSSIVTQVDSTNSANVDLSWVAPSANVTGDNTAPLLPGTFQIYRSTSIAQGTATVTVNQLLSATFTPVGSPIPWTTAGAPYSSIDSSAPANQWVAYAIVATDKNGHFAYSAPYSLVWQKTPLQQGVIVTADQTQLVVVDLAPPHASLGKSSQSSTTQVTATVIQGGKPQANQQVTFVSSDSNGTFDNNPAITNSNGQAVVTYHAGYTTGQGVTISASTAGLTGSLASPITMLAGVPQTLNSMITPTTPISGIDTIAVTDKNGNPASGVQISVAGQSCTLDNNVNAEILTTDATGKATCNVYASGQGGTVTVIASYPGISTSPASYLFTAVQNPVIIAPSTMNNVTPGSSTPFTMALYNSQWQLMTNTAVIAQASLGGTLSMPGSTTTYQKISLTTNTNGQVTFNYNAPNQIESSGLTITFYNATTLQQIGFPVPIAVDVLGPTVTATAVSSTEIDFSWTAVTGATSYDVESSPDGVNWDSSTLTTITTTKYNVTQLSPGTKYYYQVRGETTTGPTQWTSASATTFPAIVQGANAQAAANGTEIDLTWNDTSGATAYQILYEVPGATTFSSLVSGLTPTPPINTYAVTGLKPSSTYAFEIVASNSSGGTSTTAPFGTTTNPNVAVTGMTVATAAPQIYFSTDPNDVTTNTPPLIQTNVVVSGTGANNAPAVGASVSITTDRGWFVTGSGQIAVGKSRRTRDGVTVSNSISGTLDKNGQMNVVFEGRQPSGVANGPIVYPALSELGSPVFIASCGSSTFTLNGASNTLPVLVGPPNTIKLTATNNAAPSNPYFSGAWGYQGQQFTVQAKVYDALNQPVLPGQPIMITQAWNHYQGSPSNPTFDYDDPVNAASYPPPPGTTDTTGTMTMIGFTSNYSGIYTLACYAMKPNLSPATQSALSAVTNLNDNGGQALFTQNALAMGNSSAQPVSSSQPIKMVTYASDQTHWKIVSVDTPHILFDGSMSSRVTFSATDDSSKPVYPGTPFTASGQLVADCQNTTYTALGTPGSSPLFLNGNTQIVSGEQTTPTMLYFSTLGQANLISKGDGKTIGQLQLTFYNQRPSGSIQFQNVLSHYAWDPRSATIPVVTGLNSPLAGSDWNTAGSNIAAAQQQDAFTVSMWNNTLSYPNGYIVTLLDTNGAPVYDAKGNLQQGILMNGQVNFNYADDLQGNASHQATLSLLVSGEVSTGHVDEPVPFTAQTSNQSPFINVVAPASALVSPTDPVIHLPINDTFNALTALIKDDMGNPLFAGFDIKFNIVPTGGSPLAPGAGPIADAQTNQSGNVTATAFNTGTAPCYYYVQLYGVDSHNISCLLGNSCPQGQTGVFHIGLLTPSINLTIGMIPTATSIPLSIADLNPTGDVSDYDVEYSTNQTAWTVVAPPPTSTNCVVNGLTTKTTYYFRVRAHNLAWDAKDIYSAYSPIVSITTN